MFIYRFYWFSPLNSSSPFFLSTFFYYFSWGSYYNRE